MRSYDAARKSFSVLEFFGKSLIVVGFLAVVPAIMMLEDRGAMALLWAIPGIPIAAMGFFGLAYTQTSRATVDSAEYSQQSLKLARDQFEISKQLLRLAQTGPSAATHTSSENVASTPETGLSYSNLPDPEQSPDSGSDTPEQIAGAQAVLEKKVPVPVPPEQREIRYRNGSYVVGGEAFRSRNEALEHQKEILASEALIPAK